jgi:hypothetical protein
MKPQRVLIWKAASAATILSAFNSFHLELAATPRSVIAVGVNKNELVFGKKMMGDKWA